MILAEARVPPPARYGTRARKALGGVRAFLFRCVSGGGSVGGTARACKAIRLGRSLG